MEGYIYIYIYTVYSFHLGRPILSGAMMLVSGRVPKLGSGHTLASNVARMFLGVKQAAVGQSLVRGCRAPWNPKVS